jgi:hypothetical protein
MKRNYARDADKVAEAAKNSPGPENTRGRRGRGRPGIAGSGSDLREANDRRGAFQ